MNIYIPNILSLLRIICSVLLILLINHQLCFIFLYLVIGLTDILDGFIARKFKMESELGARLDSLADFFFYIILIFIIIKLYSSIITLNYKIALIGIIFVRLLNLFLNKLKYKKIVLVHTIANKISGVLLYFLPLFFFTKNDIIIWIILIVVFTAAMEEFLITIKYSEVKLNRKSIFSK